MGAVYRRVLLALVLVAVAALGYRASRRAARPAPDAPKAASTAREEAVLVCLDSVAVTGEPGRAQDLEDVEARLVPLVQARGLGRYAGHRDGEDGTVLYLYGPNAEAIYTAVEDVLRDSPLTRHARVVLREGPPGAATREIRL